MKKNPNDRMLGKSDELFLKPCASIIHRVFDFRRVQLVGSLKVLSSVGSTGFLVGSGRFLVGSAGFWSVLVLVYAHM